ncbi:MAG: hypothetical protein HN352_10935 [Bacteroidetes bacterium]|jgi:hypothetical protein|nr:hypothetical protein [Bacteroidota bacterium]MBT3749348.1 hypothetical protein [Bacteroidota bacterium]MBT4410715.1 hypothetical protein [Bacteroidota bacterium]MBT7463680.1 hypothetical protein [Bacteroidota bacterium]
MNTMVSIFRVFLISAFLLPGLSISAQVNITGNVTDAKSGLSIKDTHVFSADDLTGTHTDSTGFFSLRISGFPIIISLSHLSYHTKDILISYDPGGDYEIRLIPLIMQIDEVAITGADYRKYLTEDFFYVRDYSFTNRYIWVTGYPNKNISLPELRVMSYSGETLAKVKVGKQPELFPDAFDCVHLIESDSIFQLYYNDEIQKLYAHKKETAYKDLMSIQYIDTNKAILREAAGEENIVEYKSFNFSDSVTNVFHASFDQNLFKNAGEAKKYKHGPIPSTGGGSPMPLPIEIQLEMIKERSPIFVNKSIEELKEWIQSTTGKPPMADGSFLSTTTAFTNYALKRQIHKPIVSKLFPYDTSFVIFEDRDFLLWIYGEDLKEVACYEILLPENASDLNMIQDKTTQSLYITYGVNGLYEVAEVNPSSGEVLKIKSLKGFAFVENIQIYRGRVYFTHQSPLGRRTMNLYSTAF